MTETRVVLRQLFMVSWIVTKAAIWSLGLFGMLFQLGLPIWMVSPLVVLGSGSASCALTYAHIADISAGEIPEDTPSIADIFWLTIATMVFVVALVGAPGT